MVAWVSWLVGCTGETVSARRPADASVDAPLVEGDAGDAGGVEDAGEAGPRAPWRISRVEVGDGLVFHEIPGFSLSADEQTLYYATYLGDPCASSRSGYDLFVGSKQEFARYKSAPIQALNTGWREVSPMIAHDDSFLLFAREDNVDCSTKFGSHLWYAARDGAGFGAAVRLDGLRDPARTEAHPFARAGELFFTVIATGDGGTTSQIHRAVGSPGGWAAPTPLPPPIGGAYRDGFPFVTKDGEWLYFDSDRPGGSGGNGDIWRARRTGPGVYGAPECLPFPINSPAWEGVPRVSDDGKRIYFQRGAGIWVAEATDP